MYKYNLRVILGLLECFRGTIYIHELTSNYFMVLVDEVYKLWGISFLFPSISEEGIFTPFTIILAIRFFTPQIT